MTYNGKRLPSIGDPDIEDMISWREMSDDAIDAHFFAYISSLDWEKRLELSIEYNRLKFQRWLDGRVADLLMPRHPIDRLNLFIDAGFLLYNPDEWNYRVLPKCGHNSTKL